MHDIIFSLLAAAFQILALVMAAAFGVIVEANDRRLAGRSDMPPAHIASWLATVFAMLAIAAAMLV